MLGERLGDSIGQVSGMRVLPTEEGAACMEISFQGHGTLLGVQIEEHGTYVAVARPGGLLEGSGQGVITTEDGEVVTWEGAGRGRMLPGNATSWRGAIYHTTSSERLARLNGVTTLFEYSVDATGKTESALYEWV